MIALLRKVLPAPVKRTIRSQIKFFKYNYRHFAIKQAVQKQRPMKIIVGAAETYQPGWYSTNEQWLDITQHEHWNRVFKSRPCLTHVVAEHVFEHLTYEEAQQALKSIHDYMLPGGRIRIAVPDGYNPNKEYIRHVDINGIGDDAADHKQLLNVDVLKGLIESVGFQPEHIEGYRKDGNLIQKTYKPEDGFIMRSRANKIVQDNNPWDFPDSNTSLIVDGLKSQLAA